ncbi:hypothetical protein ZMO1_ZMOp33x032 (plasmid) [Zymomonas mobilis subsp. mobilis ZM4 = ATCC 31821]|uniref:hypothetical protein n=1 Tax=Zymomonas mobilis TaxID=542 RepID=UPI000D205A83|nr:hypothetical protein [Zymomonas mobilis]AVZ26849.1 hypothetical protein ZMO2_ZMOp33x032 [Zymomonas mobilis subsp. mobilis]AVZ28735.1 hypothetical protein ZMO3_ZMOp33x032 [Zymomonas mobilis subsp. mobilis]AVZ43181.1 hypothetical protein ZMO1_ZMOp33x032 [Zymomonas mobilis subsp. mobilis ZM4 = ATCC 31821]
MDAALGNFFAIICAKFCRLDNDGLIASLSIDDNNTKKTLYSIFSLNILFGSLSGHSKFVLTSTL